MRGLRGKVAIVTGATKTMGATIAERLIDEGVSIVGTGRSATEGEQVATALRARGGHAVFVAGDITDPAALDELVDAAVSTFGRLDIVVNNAAAIDVIRAGGERRVVDESFEVFDHMIKVGLYGPFLLAQRAIPHMLATGGGSFVNISSVVASSAQRGATGYAPSKAALESLTRQIAVDYGAEGIRANAVVTGAIRVAQNGYLHDHPVVGAAIREHVQILPRSGVAGDIAAAVAFLASDDAAFITGATLNVDGGALVKHTVPDMSEFWRGFPEATSA